MVFHAVSTTTEHGEDAPYNLAVLIAYLRAAKSQMSVYNRGQNNIKFVHNKKNPPKAVIFSDILLTFAMSLKNLLALICSTKISKISDMAKS